MTIRATSGFFRGVAYAIVPSLVLWGLIIYAVRWLYHLIGP